MISIEFKGSKIFSLENLKDLNKNKVILLLINDISFSLILWIWFIFYKFGFITSISPFFGLIIGLIQNLFTLAYLFNNGISKNNIIRYLFILLILKIIPLLTFFPDKLKFTFKDIIATIYLYLIYITVLLILKEFFEIKINLNHIILDDVTGERYKDEYSTKLYDFTYDKLISKII